MIRDATPGKHAMPGASVRDVLRRQQGADQATQDTIADELPVALSYNGAPFAVMMATPADLGDFALGFSLSEGIVDHATDFQLDAIETRLEGIFVAMTIPHDRAGALQERRRGIEGRSGCGICGSQDIEAVLRPPPPVRSRATIDEAALAHALEQLGRHQPLNAATGATHAAAFADASGKLQLVREDVGRHNALDKVIGAMAAQELDPASGFAVVTSRASYEMVLKAARAGMPLLAAISAPTTLAIALADGANLSLVGFARAHGHVVYSHAWRLVRDTGELP